MIKSILGGKSKNLFDISKAEITQHNGYWTSNADFTQHFYTQIVEPGKTYTVSYEYHNPLAGNDALSLSVQTGSGFYEGTRLYTGLIGDGKYKWVKQYGVFTIPNGVTQVTFSAFYDTMFRNLQVELGSTATEYVPHELTSYKSIMKVSDGRFVTSFDERMPCKTKNLFSSSTEVGTLEGGLGGPTVARNFEENKWYQGFATNGYYGPWNVPDFDIHPNSLYVYSNGAGYGMSRAIKCEPNTNYFISCSYSHISGGEGNVYVGYFDEGGNFISNLNMGKVYKINFTTPNNCKWLIIDFVTQEVGKVYFSDIQLVKGTTATDYVPYGYV